MGEWYNHNSANMPRLSVKHMLRVRFEDLIDDTCMAWHWEIGMGRIQMTACLKGIWWTQLKMCEAASRPGRYL